MMLVSSGSKWKSTVLAFHNVACSGYQLIHQRQHQHHHQRQHQHQRHHRSLSKYFLNTKCQIPNLHGENNPRCYHSNKDSATTLSVSASGPESMQPDENKKTYQDKLQDLQASSRLSLAPMMEYTDRHFRHMFRLLSNHTLLYTEMVPGNAIAHEYQFFQNQQAHDPNSEVDDWQLRRFLSQSHLERDVHKSVLQLGGSDPAQLYTSAVALMDRTNRGECDYTAINLNCGCPSPKVAGKGCFGAALMDDPILVKDCCRAIYEGTDKNIPVTVKCRIGTDLNWENSQITLKDYKTREDTKFEEAEYQKLCEFIDTISSDDVVTDFQIHARIAVLKTKQFSPADNRKIPPLKYDFVHRLTNEFPHLTFSLNGGIETLNQVQTQLNECPELHGVMVGRGMAANPWGYAVADEILYNDSSDMLTRTNRWELLKAYGKYADKQEEIWSPKIRRFIIKAVQSLFMGEPNAKKFRIELDRVGGLPKQFVKKGLPLDYDTTTLSEYIMNAASEYLKDEILMRSPMESYERTREMEERAERKKLGIEDPKTFLTNTKINTKDASNSSNNDTKSFIAQEWQVMREEDRESRRLAKDDGEENMMDYDKMLEEGSDVAVASETESAN